MKAIDLFAGCGGFSLGFIEAGFIINKAVEIDSSIANTYRNNHLNTEIIVKDISTIDNSFFFQNKEADVIIGGPPCQGFSMAGARIRNGFIDDPRNYLFKHYFNILKIVKPKAFIIENVKGLLTMHKGTIFNEMIKLFSDKELLEGDYYNIYYKVFNAKDFGIPQNRERLIIIGTLNKQYNFDKIFEKVKIKIQSKYPHYFESVSVWDAISDLSTLSTNDTIHQTIGNNVINTEYQKFLNYNKSIIYNHIATNHSKIAEQRMQKISSGENYLKLNEKINSVHSGSYGRLEKDKISPTITTRFDTPSAGRFIHPELNRTLTPREAARIQSFPDSFRFYGNKTSICKQIGNAVPPKISYFLAESIKEVLIDE